MLMNKEQKTNRHWIIGISLATLIISAWASPLLARTVEKIVAVVNENAITSSDLDAAVKEYGPDLRKTKGLSGTALQKEVLNALIDDQLIETEIEKSKIVVKPHEIDSYTERIIQSSRMTLDQFKEELRKKGKSFAQYKEVIQKKMMRNKFIGQKIGHKVSISERELKEYFEAHMDDFKSPTSIQLAQISIAFTPKTTPENFKNIETLAISIRNACKSSNNFEALAKRFNSDTQPVHGGNLGVVSIKDLQPSIAQAVSNLGPGEVSSPVVSDTGIHILKVIDRAKTSTKDFSSVRDNVYNTIYDFKLQLSVKGYAKELRKKAHIQILSLGTNS